MVRNRYKYKLRAFEENLLHKQPLRVFKENLLRKQLLIRWLAYSLIGALLLQAMIISSVAYADTTTTGGGLGTDSGAAPSVSAGATLPATPVATSLLGDAQITGGLSHTVAWEARNRRWCLALRPYAGKGIIRYYGNLGWDEPYACTSQRWYRLGMGPE
jgi:hypothetical protein